MAHSMSLENRQPGASTVSLWRGELRAMLALAWPLVLTNLSMALIGATDVLMVGWLGPTQLAAASLGFNLTMIGGIFSMGLVTASAPLLASELGRMRNSVREVRRTFRQSLWTGLIVCLPVWAILWHSEAILLAMGQLPHLASAAQDYVRAYMWSLLPFMWLIAMRNFLSAKEKPLWSLIIGVGGVLANALFNYALIFGHFGLPRLELVGAGIGSVLANLCMAAAMAVVLTRHRDFRRYRLFGRWWRSDWQRLREMWALGLPIGISMGLEGGVFSVAAILMGRIGEAALAAHAVALQIASVSFMVPMGLAQAATVRVGLGHGMRDPAMIRRAGWTGFALGTGFMTIMAGVILLMPMLLIGLFMDARLPANAQVVPLAAQYLLVAALFQVADGAQVVGQGMLRGLQDTRWPMLFAAFGYWVVGIGVGAWLAFEQGWDGVGIWAGLAVGLCIVAVLMIGRWLLRHRLGLVPAPHA